MDIVEKSDLLWRSSTLRTPPIPYECSYFESGSLDMVACNLIYRNYICYEVSMNQASVQVPVLMSPAQKRRLARKAKAANLTMGELLRRGGERFSPTEDEAMLNQFAKQVARATEKAIQSIEKTLALVAESEARMQALSKSRRKH